MSEATESGVVFCKLDDWISALGMSGNSLLGKPATSDFTAVAALGVADAPELAGSSLELAVAVALADCCDDGELSAVGDCEAACSDVVEEAEATESGEVELPVEQAPSVRAVINKAEAPATRVLPSEDRVAVWLVRWGMKFPCRREHGLTSSLPGRRIFPLQARR